MITMRKLGMLTTTVALYILPQLSFAALPNGFVYLKDVDPSIIQDIRYAGDHNFVGRPIKGYQEPTCILSKQAAEALKNVQTQLRKQNMSLKVYDCYRPQMASDDFYAWSQKPDQAQMKKEFYPEVDKSDLFKMGYIAKRSEHSSGSTMDVTIVPIPTPKQPTYTKGQTLVACFAPYNQRFKDNSIDMGTGYDCLDFRADTWYKRISQRAQANRTMLRSLMVKNGFKPYAKEWWHFTLKNQPYSGQAFNFPVK